MGTNHATPLTPDEIEALLDSRPLPGVDIGEIERRMQTCYGLRDGVDCAMLMEALRQASEDVCDLLACLRGHYRPL